MGGLRTPTAPHPSRRVPRRSTFPLKGGRADLGSGSIPSSSKPARIVSTNVCADQLALALADRGRVISVSRMAIEPQISNFADAARGIAINHARAEEIVELKPDLILGDIYTGKGANRLAQTLGVPVHIIGFAASLEDVRQIIRDAAKALGEPERGETLIANMSTRITKTHSPNTKTVTALVYEPNGITTSTGTLTHDILTTAGLTNIAPKLMHGSYGSVPLEAVVAAAPQLLILDDSYAGTSSRAQSTLRHPALKSLEGKTARYDMPSRLWLCPGPWVAEAVERLAEERARLGRTLAPAAKAE
ncbi:MAG: ABC transporter substrate-binding protein [Alphaproteobacteria bacterium]|nr:ABC transporter substrate-binding protein [Alphaproteobacteria bacterium]